MPPRTERSVADIRIGQLRRQLAKAESLGQKAYEVRNLLTEAQRGLVGLSEHVARAREEFEAKVEAWRRTYTTDFELMQKARALLRDLEREAGSLEALEVEHTRFVGRPFHGSVEPEHSEKGEYGYLTPVNISGPPRIVEYYHGERYVGNPARPELVAAAQEYAERQDREMAAIRAQVAAESSRVATTRTRARKAHQEARALVPPTEAAAQQARAAIEKASAPVQRTLF